MSKRALIDELIRIALVDTSPRDTPDPSLAAFARDDDEKAVLSTIGFYLTRDQRKQLRWLILRDVLAETVTSGTCRKARCNLAVQQLQFPRSPDDPDSSMRQAWTGKSGMGDLARTIVRLMTAAQKAEVVRDLLPLVSENSVF